MGKTAAALRLGLEQNQQDDGRKVESFIEVLSDFLINILKFI